MDIFLITFIPINTIHSALYKLLILLDNGRTFPNKQTKNVFMNGSCKQITFTEQCLKRAQRHINLWNFSLSSDFHCFHRIFHHLFKYIENVEADWNTYKNWMIHNSIKMKNGLLAIIPTKWLNLIEKCNYICNQWNYLLDLVSLLEFHMKNGRVSIDS